MGIGYRSIKFSGTLSSIYLSLSRSDLRPLSIYIFSCVLYCSVLHCSVLYCSVLYCSVLYCSVLYCSVPYRSVLYRFFLYRSVFYRSVLYRSFLYRSVLYRSVLCVRFLLQFSSKSSTSSSGPLMTSEEAMTSDILARVLAVDVTVCLAGDVP